MDYTDGLHTITEWFECDNSQVIINWIVELKILMKFFFFNSHSLSSN